MEFTAAFAYVLNKYTFRGRGFLYGIALFMVSVPIGASMVSTYRLIYALNLDNSMLILVTAANVYGMNLILTYAYWANISWTYAEAAQMDGAGFYYTYFKIMRPQVLPLMFTLGLLAFITKWNDYMSPLLYLPDRSANSITRACMRECLSVCCPFSSFLRFSPSGSWGR